METILVCLILFCFVLYQIVNYETAMSLKTNVRTNKFVNDFYAISFENTAIVSYFQQQLERTKRRKR
jgi:hypothetical protein